MIGCQFSGNNQIGSLGKLLQTPYVLIRQGDRLSPTLEKSIPESEVHLLCYNKGLGNTNIQSLNLCGKVISYTNENAAVQTRQLFSS